MPAPQLATASITDRIQALNGKESILPFEIKALERDIERLKAVSAAEAYMLTGMLNAALGKYEESKASHQKSLRLTVDDVGLVNYAISLRMLGRLSEAKVTFIQAMERSPASSDILEKLIRTCTFLCDYEDLEDIKSRFIKANPEYDLEDMPCMENVRSILQHLDRLGIPLSEFKAVGAFIEQTMIEFDLVAEHMHERISSFDGVQHVYVEIPTPIKDAAQLVALNDRFTDLILGCDEITHWDKLIVNFVDSRTAPTSAVA